MRSGRMLWVEIAEICLHCVLFAQQRKVRSGQYERGGVCTVVGVLRMGRRSVLTILEVSGVVEIKGEVFEGVSKCKSRGMD